MINNISANPQKKTFLIMKVVAIALILSVLSLFIWQKENGAIHKYATSHSLALGPESARPPSPNFSLKINDKELNIKDIRAKAIHINFWAEWCKPCVTELPKLELLAKNYGPEKYQILLINLDITKETIERAKKMQRQLAPSLISIYEDTDDLKILFNVAVLPYHVLLDKKKKIAAAFYSSINVQEKKLTHVLDQLISEETLEEQDL